MNRIPDIPAIAAVFVTFNRRQDALTCVDRLLAQELPIHRIVVVINGSTDGTEAALRENYGTNPKLVIVTLQSNLGNAGGMRVGFKSALSTTETEWVWILDDDAHPSPDALRNLVGSGIDPGCTYASVVVDPVHKELSFPVTFIDGETGRTVNKIGELPHADSFEIPCSWLGALVSRRGIETVGLPDERLFIRGEDVEYPVRLRKAGFRCFCRRNAIVVHPAQHLRQFAVIGLGRPFGYEPGLAMWKFYYLVRNRMHVHRIAARTERQGILKGLAASILWITAAVVFDDQKLGRVLTIVQATAHGLTGNFSHGPRPPIKAGSGKPE